MEMLETVLTRGKFETSSDGKENSNDLVQTEWIDWILFTVSCLNKAGKSRAGMLKYFGSVQ